MSKLSALKAATSRSELANLLQMKPQGLTAVLYGNHAAKRYKTFTIPKKNGGTRVIKAPDKPLKLIQQKLSILLQDCLEEIDAELKHPYSAAHGFRKKRSILTNAGQHRNRRWVFNIDLENFFPSIHYGRVRGYFIKDRNFSLTPEVATTLAQIACDGIALPQGSPCSPVISNLVGRILDARLVQLAAAVGCNYSRYADDLTFSTNKKEFPSQLAVRSTLSPNAWLPGKSLNRTIKLAGFSINSPKTRMQYRDSRQDVTGLVVNQKINIRREYRHAVRAMVHRLCSEGSFQVTTVVTNNGATPAITRDGSLEELGGRIAFINSIDRYNDRGLPSGKPSPQLISKQRLYHQFLIYQDFYAARTPVIICEGKTDNIYIKNAIRALANKFTELVEVDKSGKPHLKVRLYKYAGSTKGRVLGLNAGGTGGFPKFIADYRKVTGKFKAPGLMHPIILICDNDDGATPITQAIKEASKRTVNRDEPYTNIFKNLYVVFTPREPNKSSQIEDFFDTITKGILLNGKEFTTQEKLDTDKYYGKSIFANAIVARQAHSIDFSGFTKLLENISTVVTDHAKARTPYIPHDSAS